MMKISALKNVSLKIALLRQKLFIVVYLCIHSLHIGTGKKSNKLS